MDMDGMGSPCRPFLLGDTIMNEIKELHLDVETYSSVNIVKGGAYRYVSSDDFEILLLGYSINGGDVKVVDLANGEKIPDEVISAITDDGVTKFAHNATFERICFSSS